MPHLEAHGQAGRPWICFRAFNSAAARLLEFLFMGSECSRLPAPDRLPISASLDRFLMSFYRGVQDASELFSCVKFETSEMWIESVPTPYNSMAIKMDAIETFRSFPRQTRDGCCCLLSAWSCFFRHNGGIITGQPRERKLPTNWTRLLVTLMTLKAGSAK
jgi:hypothetical protein